MQMSAARTILAIIAQGGSFSCSDLQEKSGLPLQKVKRAMLVLHRGRCIDSEPLRFAATAAGVERHVAEVAEALRAQVARAEKLAEAARNRKSPGRKALPEEVREARYRERVRHQIEKRAEARRASRLADEQVRAASEAERTRVAEVARALVQQACASRPAIEWAWAAVMPAMDGSSATEGGRSAD
jgi:ABC-type transporter Mla subunit MlaD